MVITSDYKEIEKLKKEKESNEEKTNNDSKPNLLLLSNEDSGITKSTTSSNSMKSDILTPTSNMPDESKNSFNLSKEQKESVKDSQIFYFPSKYQKQSNNNTDTNTNKMDNDKDLSSKLLNKDVKLEFTHSEVNTDNVKKLLKPDVSFVGVDLKEGDTYEISPQGKIKSQ